MTLSDDRLHDLIRFYEILDMLAERIGGPRILAECTGRVRLNTNQETREE
jgi:hypothetical protein